MQTRELKLTYQNEDFGKPNKDGTWSIRNDIKTYTLIENDVEIVDITIEYERFSNKQPDYACAHVSYSNHFFNTNHPKYENKGYASIALETITEFLLRDGKVPKISLDINPNNLASKRVAEKNGYIYVMNNEYSIYHPNALKMIEHGLEYLKKEDEDLYNTQLNFNIKRMKIYLENCIKQSEKDKERRKLK